MEEETEELKKHLHIVTDDYDDDDVYTDATSLPLRISIIDYKIHTKRNRPYFKIISADGNYIALCYPNNDSENLGKLQAKGDIASVASLVPEVPISVIDAPAPVESTGIASLTTVDQDAHSPSTS
nr:hypothetical protein [Tanacetum cinerariifolium]